VSYLTHRAERAVIGALLADPGPPDHTYGLTAADFSSRLHREIYTAVTDLALARPDLAGEQRDQVIAGMLTLPGATLDDLRQLREDAPDHAATAAYAQMVRTAAIYRDIAAHADDIARNLATTEPDDPDADTELLAHNRRLAMALARHAEAFRPVTAPPFDAPDTGYPMGVVVEAPAIARSQRAELEDQVLADLLRDPEQINTLREFLTDNAFTSSGRRHVYRTMASMAFHGEPVDEVTVTWRVEIEQAQARLHGVDVNAPGTTGDESVHPVTDTDTEPTAVYLARLAATTIVVTSAIHAARDLLAAHLKDTLPDPATVVAAAAATAARAARTQALRQRQTTPQQVTSVEPQRPGYSSARPPGPLPATDTPQLGAHPDPNLTPRPGIRP
jgi:replicative DNA helicase